MLKYIHILLEKRRLFTASGKLCLKRIAVRPRSAGRTSMAGGEHMKNLQRWGNPALSGMATACIALICYYFGVPNPNVILITAVVLFTFIGGFLSGSVSAGVVIAYSLLFFSIPEHLLHYTMQNLYKVIVIVAFVPVQVMLVGVLKERADIRSEKLEQANEQLKVLSGMDFLTQLPNRRRFDTLVDEAYARADRTGLPICCALIDIDYFKQYNDCYGHLTGDECLRQVAQAIREGIRGTGNVAARFGGDEFVILFPETGVERAREICAKIKTGVEELRIPHQKSPISTHVTISVGIASFRPNGSGDKAELLRRADRASYLAKELGRSRIEALETE